MSKVENKVARTPGTASRILYFLGSRSDLHNGIPRFDIYIYTVSVSYLHISDGKYENFRNAYDPVLASVLRKFIFSIFLLHNALHFNHLRTWFLFNLTSVPWPEIVHTVAYIDVLAYGHNTIGSLQREHPKR